MSIHDISEDSVANIASFLVPDPTVAWTSTVPGNTLKGAVTKYYRVFTTLKMVSKYMYGVVTKHKLLQVRPLRPPAKSQFSHELYHFVLSLEHEIMSCDYLQQSTQSMSICQLQHPPANYVCTRLFPNVVSLEFRSHVKTDTVRLIMLALEAGMNTRDIYRRCIELKAKFRRENVIAARCKSRYEREVSIRVHAMSDIPMYYVKNHLRDISSDIHTRLCVRYMERTAMNMLEDTNVVVTLNELYHLCKTLRVMFDTEMTEVQPMF